jgi:hypothetical protein
MIFEELSKKVIGSAIEVHRDSINLRATVSPC